jgi:hypothetical protein
MLRGGPLRLPVGALEASFAPTFALVSVRPVNGWERISRYT